MATARYRITDYGTNMDGSYFHAYYYPDSLPTSVYAQDERKCWDVIGNWDSTNPLTIIQTKISPGVMNGKYYDGDGNLYKQMTDVAIKPLYLPDAAPVTEPTELELSNLAWDTLARSNPSAAHVSVPTFIGELKDLPMLIKDWGGDLLKKVAKGHLSWRWAIKPMISDIRKFLDFAEAVDQRIKDLERLRSDRFLSKRAGLGGSSGDTVGTQYRFLWAQGGTRIGGYHDNSWTSRSWGSSQWRLSSSTSLPKTNSELIKLAQQLTFGITTYESLLTAWELLPWSWFADWFLGIQTVLSASNNTLSLTPSRISIMRTTTAVVKARVVDAPDISWITTSGKPSAKVTTKERWSATTALPFTPSYAPLFDKGKWSILGTLAVLRRK